MNNNSKMHYTTYSEFFKKATSFDPYPYQINIAENKDFPQILEVPTGTGKTSSIVIAWIWKLLQNNETYVPQRLVYCLPMRSIVEQVRDNINLWLKNIDCDKIKVVTIMGGETTNNWDIYPEDNCIIVGTQDMLISRALNRGYGMSKYRWPMQFSLLNNDALWVMDETQLMGNGLNTTMQLQSFRERYGTFGTNGSIWMSATIGNALQTVDFSVDTNKIAKLSSQDYENDNIKKIINAKKSVEINNFKSLNDLVKDITSNKEQKIIVIVNNVKSAINLYDKLKDNYDPDSIVLLHSHFRRPDKVKKIKIARELNDPNKKSIIISTQVVEAGMDISCELMYTEAAPLSSLIQRFGRCNRFGEYSDGKIIIFEHGKIFNDKKEIISPYNDEDVKSSIETLKQFNNQQLTPEIIDTLNKKNIIQHNRDTFLRENDIIELFDTAPDISGQDMDVSIFVRDLSSSNVFVFWRDLKNKDFKSQSLADSDELCQASITDIKNSKFGLFKYNFLDGKWEAIKNKNTIIPGTIILIDSNSGGYTSEKGYDNDFKGYVEEIKGKKHNKSSDSYSADENSIKNAYMTLNLHTQQVVEKCNYILTQINSRQPVFDKNTIDNIIGGALWHDAGKSHDAFQARIIKNENDDEIYAKAPDNKWRRGMPARYDPDLKLRKYFRHELVSGLLAWQNGESNEVAYLAAAHHGKVRLSISSIGGEYIPENKQIFAKGVWDKDIIQPFNLNGININQTELDMSLMQIGSFDKESWIHMVISLYKKYGIFKLAYMETIVRAADQRASGNL